MGGAGVIFSRVTKRWEDEGGERLKLIQKESFEKERLRERNIEKEFQEKVEQGIFTG